jgi:hypothetical protein
MMRVKQIETEDNEGSGLEGLKMIRVHVHKKGLKMMMIQVRRNWMMRI